MNSYIPQSNNKMFQNKTYLTGDKKLLVKFLKNQGGLNILKMRCKDSKLFILRKLLLRKLAKIENFYIICVGRSDLDWQGSCKYSYFVFVEKWNLIIR
ncbi:unnamed protein product [Rhizophagus irregularis]|nr:unnamed protein product [Rhizophagus irregularis]